MLNAGHALFLSLGSDGRYEVRVSLVDDAPSSEEATAGAVTANLQCVSGRLFVGAGEEVTSDGMEPEGDRGGGFVSVPPGCYRLSATRQGPQLSLTLSPGGGGNNALALPLRLA